MSLQQTWHSLNLGDAMLAGEPLERIRQQFRSAYGNSGEESLALYFRHESEGHLHCEVRVYFPPGATGLARELGASPCRPPSTDDLGVLASI